MGKSGGQTRPSSKWSRLALRARWDAPQSTSSEARGRTSLSSGIRGCERAEHLVELRAGGAGPRRTGLRISGGSDALSTLLPHSRTKGAGGTGRDERR
jgi:hypothetical protein